MHVAIIGAGLAGLACADALVAQGHAATLFDKGRGPGGRMSTRRVEVDGRTVRFDHGAQYFTVRDHSFAEEVDRWAAAGVAARWPDAGADAWVGTPGMNAPVRALTGRHDVRWATRVDGAVRDGTGWHLVGADGPGAFDAVVVATPAEQAAPLLTAVPAFAATAAAARSAPCWTMMAAFGEAIATDRVIVRETGAIGWAARDGAKPGRDGGDTWVVQATPDWSTEHLEQSSEQVAPMLLAALGDALGVSLPGTVHLSAHRWRYARSGGADGPGALWDAGQAIGACGDWLLAPRVEAAWLSGRRLAALIAG